MDASTNKCVMIVDGTLPLGFIANIVSIMNCLLSTFLDAMMAKFKREGQKHEHN